VSSGHAVVHRTANGYTVESSGDGFYHRPEGSTDFRFVPAGQSVALGANDHIRLGNRPDAPVLTFRAEQPRPAGPEAANSSPMRVVTDGPLRHVEFTRPDGSIESTTLLPRGGWFYGPTTGSIESPVKLHISVTGAHDLSRVQPVVMQALMQDPVLRRLVTLWKTMDPNHGIGEQARATGMTPSGEGQGLKGFTIYTGNAADALIVQQRISQILVERGLGLPAPISTHNVDVVDSATNRVGITRDTWPATSDINHRPGYLLDSALTERMHEQLGIQSGSFLSATQRRTLEQQLGLAPNTLSYDSAGRLMVRARNVTSYHGGLYADEGHARTPEGLTDRPALYALYRHFGIDPVQQAVGAPSR
jgi:hypothetical protein